jgi:type I restriction enzyme M protein
MSDDQKRKLESKLWAIANELRGKMNADDFRDYILGFIFFKYLSERMYLFANDILEKDGISYERIDENTEEGKEYLSAIEVESGLTNSVIS